jgi:hypothetical protein
MKEETIDGGCNPFLKTKSVELILLLFILTANGFLPGGSGNAIRHNKQITHITQNNTTIIRNTAHKTTHTIKDTLYRMNASNHNYNYINDMLIGLTLHYIHCRNLYRMSLSDIHKLVRIIGRKVGEDTSYSWEEEI